MTTKTILIINTAELFPLLFCSLLIDSTLTFLSLITQVQKVTKEERHIRLHSPKPHRYLGKYGMVLQKLGGNESKRMRMIFLIQKSFREFPFFIAFMILNWLTLRWLLNLQTTTGLRSWKAWGRRLSIPLRGKNSSPSLNSCSNSYRLTLTYQLLCEYCK